jgi:hypothetical protein
MLLSQLFYIPFIITSFIVSLPYILYLIASYNFSQIKDNLLVYILGTDITYPNILYINMPYSNMPLLQSIDMSNYLIITQLYIKNSWIGMNIIKLFTYIKQRFK